MAKCIYQFDVSIRRFNKPFKLVLPTLGLFISIILVLTSCKKLVEAPPPVSSITGANVYSTDGTAAAVLTGLYTNMSQNNIAFVTGINSISVESGLSADELSLFGGSSSPNTSLVQFYENALTNTQYLTFWEQFYSCLLTVNSAIEGLGKATSLTPTVKKQLQGEAKFMRAFCFFYLVNLYGNVPLDTTIDYRTNSKIARSPKDQIYKQIISDLKDAQNLLNSNYSDATIIKTTTSRVRPNKYAATALLARIYLYIGAWADAEAQSDSVIDNSDTYNLVSDLNSVFLENSSEAIWQLQPVIAGQNTQDALVFILTGGPNDYNNPVYLSPFLLNAFESEDKRFIDWVGIDSSTGLNYYYPNKYKSAMYGAPITENLMILRLAEQYLIRAEAKARQSKNIAGAQSDLNAIRTRAGLPNTSANDQPSIIAAIQHERQVELFTEWGHRWLDLKRLSAVDSVMNVVAQQKGGVWNTNWQWYPLPLYDLQTNAKLIQNVGY